MATTVPVTGVTGFGVAGASIPMELEDGGFLLLEDGFALSIETTEIVTATAAAEVPVAGLEATGAVSGVTVIGTAEVLTAGLEATAAVTGVTVAANAEVPVTGLEAEAFVGSVVVTADAEVPVTGLEATAAAGTMTIIGTANVPLADLEATAEVGSVGVVAGTGTTVNLAGLSAEAITLGLFVWSPLEPEAETLWIPIERSLFLLEAGDALLLEDGSFLLQELSTPESEWSTIEPTPEPDWTPVAA